MIQASLSGRLGKDPRAIETKTGTPMVSVSVAVDVSSYKGESTVWVSVTAFGKYAEILGTHIKGDTIAASGRLEMSHWTPEDGVERESWTLIADHIHSARTVRQGGGHGGKGRRKTDPPADGSPPSEPAPNQDEGRPFDDEIPF
ncbi:single-stranded DNA-binding protein [uncultured Thiodictyon sp.]|uniref:single-stranded DNA-binding protein n=1 Tax=uncultured Thiodictyon sp. TaxID=1846217 RepID=UPI0025EB6E68|nr:single-stranded DNA-binding protein [uncultured Thiodictyon sp.]